MDEEEVDDSGTLVNDAQVNPQEEKVVKKAARGTTKNFKTIASAIFQKVQPTSPTLTRTNFYTFLENKQRDYYDLNFSADEVYDEMERLYSLEAGRILQEVMPSMQEEEPPIASQKNKRGKRRLSTDGNVLDRTEVEDEEEDGDIHTDGGLPKRITENEVPITQASGQQSLTSMWGTPPSTSQETNMQQNGGEQ